MTKAAGADLASDGGPVAIAKPAWRSAPERASLDGMFRSVSVAAPGASGLRKLLAFAGPGFMVAVGYMDPGNWATDIAGGSAFGYELLSVVVLSGLMAIVLQALAARLGVATGRDLAQACRDHFSPRTNVVLWLLAEVGICACDLAELLGAALGLKLLLGVPMVLGVCLTVLDVFVVLALQRFGFRKLEAVILALIAIVAGCLLAQVILARPDAGAVLRGFIPVPGLVTNRQALYLAVGVIGATIMPHNLYLHSSIVQTRRYSLSEEGRAEAATLAGWDSALALVVATAVNAAILVLAAATFHAGGRTQVADIAQAGRMLAPLLGSAASVLFALGLLASGQNSAVTATLTGQIVMEGFVQLRLSPWKRRLATRLLAAAPAVAVMAVVGERGVGGLLVLSQVILALQLPFAVVPLVLFTGDRRKMGALTNPGWLAGLAWGCTLVIVALNLVLIGQLVWPR